MKKILSLLSIIGLSLVLQSHIGSPGVTLEGSAGPYPLTVVVIPPEVIPGTAQVDIYLQNSRVSSVKLKPMYWFAGSEGTPKADEALPVAGERGHYTGEVWLMSSGTASLQVEVEGQQGSGSILVPINAVSTAQKTMEASLGWTLAGLGAFLVLLMVTILSLSSSDGLLPPGQEAGKKIRRRRWLGAAVGFVVLSLMVWGGKSWWDSWSNNYQRYMYKPYTASSQVRTESNKQILEFNIDSVKLESLYLTRSLNYLVPDHGKIMHMFLLKKGSLDVFAHLHPSRKDSARFETIIPPLPGGEYYVFTDVSRLSGFSETIADTVVIPDPKPELTAAWHDSLLLDTDDTYYITDPVVQQTKGALLPGGDVVVCGSPGKKTRLPDSSYVTLELPEEQKFLSGKLYDLTLAVQDPQGKPAQLEPYLGMMGHAVVFKQDGSVYIHLHPVGSYSMASQETMQSRFDGKSGRIDWEALPKPEVFADSIDREIARLNAMSPEARDEILLAGMEHPELNRADHPEHSVVSFPYTFPTAGKYRIYVQMKRNGKILNGAFDVEVED